MEKIKLDSRLDMVASLVRQGSVVADIGTDHAYLVCYLLQKGIISKAVAADLRKGPLENARQTVELCGVSDSVKLILSDGLEKIEPYSCDDIVLAGMGGILISEILEKAKWVFDEKIHIVAQPMTHAEVLRTFLITNGFSILQEKTAADQKHCYCAISAVYTGEIKQCPSWYSYLGEVIKNGDDTSKRYVMKVYTSLKKKYDALFESGRNDEALRETLSIIEEKIKEAGLWLS